MASWKKLTELPSKDGVYLLRFRKNGRESLWASYYRVGTDWGAREEVDSNGIISSVIEAEAKNMYVRGKRVLLPCRDFLMWLCADPELMD